MEELLTVQEVAAALRVHRKTVYDLMRAGRLEYVRIGMQRGRRITRSEVERFIRENKGMAGTGSFEYNPEEMQSPSLAAA